MESSWLPWKLSHHYENHHEQKRKRRKNWINKKKRKKKKQKTNEFRKCSKYKVKEKTFPMQIKTEHSTTNQVSLSTNCSLIVSIGMEILAINQKDNLFHSHRRIIFNRTVNNLGLNNDNLFLPFTSFIFSFWLNFTPSRQHCFHLFPD